MGTAVNASHAIPTRAEMKEMGFGDDEELTISLPVWSDDEEADADGGDERPPVAAAVNEVTLEETLRRLRTVAPQHNHADRQLHADAALLAPPEIAPPFRIAHADVSSFSPEQFQEEFVRPGKPVMLHGVPEQGRWRATERWGSADRMADHYGHVPLKVWEIAAAGGMGKGMPIELPLRQYVEYARSNTVDSPFYVFQKQFTPQHDELRSDYEVPEYFRDDLYNTTPKIRSQFPLYRYFVVGGGRTGSTMHTDPHFTAAWNTLLCGHKRWVLFPPTVSVEELGMSQLTQQVREPPAYWWQDTYPDLVRTGRAAELGMVEAVQEAGDTIYVPQGWHHCVLNLDWTVAITQNLLLPAMLADVWPQMRTKFASFAGHFARRLCRHRPEVLADLERRGIVRPAEYETADSDGEDDEHEGFRL